MQSSMDCARSLLLPFLHSQLTFRLLVLPGIGLPESLHGSFSTKVEERAASSFWQLLQHHSHVQAAELTCADRLPTLPPGQHHWGVLTLPLSSPNRSVFHPPLILWTRLISLKPKPHPIGLNTILKGSSIQVQLSWRHLGTTSCKTKMKPEVGIGR